MTKDRAVEDRAVGGDRLQESAVDRMVIEAIVTRVGLKGVHGEWVRKDPEAAERRQA
jgi:hypothetical protein